MTQAVDAPMNQGEVSELLACPFCAAPLQSGGELVPLWVHPRLLYSHRHCPARAVTFEQDDADAIAAWNRRHSGAKAGDAVGVKESRDEEDETERALNKIVNDSIAHVKARVDEILSALSPSPGGGEAVARALEDSNSLLASMLHEARSRDEIEAQIVANRSALLAPARPELPNGELDQRALEAATKAWIKHSGDDPERAIRLTREISEPLWVRYRGHCEATIRAYLNAAPLPQDLSRGERAKQRWHDVGYLMAVIDSAIEDGFDPDEDGPLLDEIRAELEAERALSEAGKPDTKGERE